MDFRLTQKETARHTIQNRAKFPSRLISKINVPTSITPNRRKLLIALESIIGNEFYNPSIQNYGPGGIREPDGRALRYPLSVQHADGVVEKIRTSAIPGEIGDEALRSGYYRFGANQLDVMKALDQILTHLEANYGLVVDEDAGASRGDGGKSGGEEAL